MTAINRVTRDGKTIGWRARWPANPGGRFFKRHSDARDFVERMNLTKIRAGREAPTVSEVFTKLQSTRRVSAKRLATDESFRRNHFGEFGDMKVTEVTKSDVLEWVAGLVDKGLDPSTVAKILQLVRRALDLAVDDRLIDLNPAKSVKAPPKPSGRVDRGDVFTQHELELLISVAPERWRALIAFRGYVGPRPSEAFALRVRDFDTPRCKVHLGHRVTEQVNGEIVIRVATPEELGGKTDSAERWPPVPQFVLDRIADHIRSYPARVPDRRCGACGATFSPRTTRHSFCSAACRAKAHRDGLTPEPVEVTSSRDDLVFVTSAGTTPSSSNFRRDVWRPALTRLGEKLVEEAGEDTEAVEIARERAERILSIPFYNLRHTAASLMLDSGMDVVKVAARLGHKKPSFTLDIYARLLPSDETQEDPFAVKMRAGLLTPGGNGAMSRDAEVAKFREFLDQINPDDFLVGGSDL